jgi:hypothetical protein
VANYSPFCKKYFEKANLLSNIPCFFFVFNYLKTETFALKIASIAYSMKGCLRFFTFIFWILPNLAKYTYMDDCHLSNITKLGGGEKKNQTLNTKPNHWELKDKKSQLKYQNPLSKRHAQVGFREDIKSKKDGNRCWCVTLDSESLISLCLMIKLVFFAWTKKEPQ